MNSLSKYLSILDQATIWDGNHGESNRLTHLRAGLLSMVYENGNLRYISAGGNELVRMIYSAVRDREWLTIRPVISGEKFDIKPDSFKIEYRCLYMSGEIEFSAVYRIEGRSDSTLSFSFEGEALSTFMKCRIGFCILHPVGSCAGNPCLITHSDGSQETIEFPVFISPDEIFLDIISMKWNVSGSECELNFTGDIFETEDQRNWTDASYKTYCTPGSLPCPATVAKGEKIAQNVELSVRSGEKLPLSGDAGILFSVDQDVRYAMPLLGIGSSTRRTALTDNETAILRALGFDHYRADVYLFNAGWEKLADTAAAEADGLKYALELALFLDDDYLRQLDDFAAWLEIRKRDISVILLLHKSDATTPDMLISIAVPMLKRILPDVRIGCGTNANFAQLNRKVPASDLADLLCYSVHPQEHASDNTTLVENIAGQVYTAESARQLSGKKGIWISPVNLQRRFNANIENYETPLSGDELPPQVDSRIMSLFGAGWTAGCLKNLTEAGVNGITFLETAGERGIIQGDNDSRWPEYFKGAKGMIFPVYHLFRWLLKDKGSMVFKSVSSAPLEADILALSHDGQIRICLVNHTSLVKKVKVIGLSGKIKIKILNAATYTEAATDTDWIGKNWENRAVQTDEMILDPYSLTFIEGTL